MKPNWYEPRFDGRSVKRHRSPTPERKYEEGFLSFQNSPIDPDEAESLQARAPHIGPTEMTAGGHASDCLDESTQEPDQQPTNGSSIDTETPW